MNTCDADTAAIIAVSIIVISLIALGGFVMYLVWRSPR